MWQYTYCIYYLVSEDLFPMHSGLGSLHLLAYIMYACMMQTRQVSVRLLPLILHWFGESWLFSERSVLSRRSEAKHNLQFSFNKTSKYPLHLALSSKVRNFTSQAQASRARKNLPEFRSREGQVFILNYRSAQAGRHLNRQTWPCSGLCSGGTDNKTGSMWSMKFDLWCC